jgi:SAM-dependent methyltransferase
VWHGTVMPRLAGFLPARHILEIAPGRGRFTAKLLGLGARVTAVDVTRECIDHCKARFWRQRWLGRARFHVNDGRSLAMVAPASVDLAFSWDSLVHCERDVIESYVHELARVLRPGGVGMLHHSNLGNFAEGEVRNPGWRGRSMTWQLFREFCEQAGMWCVCQEPRTFNQPQMIDCISVFCRPGDPRQTAPEPVLFENEEFYRETHNLNRIARMYRREAAK